MEAAAVKAVVEGLKQAGVDFISLLPDSDFSDLQHQVASDTHFTYVPVSNEAIGVESARERTQRQTAGAARSTSGLLVAAWPLTSICMAWSLPLLLLIPYAETSGMLSG